jgi:hypothetical protein
VTGRDRPTDEVIERAINGAIFEDIEAELAWHVIAISESEAAAYRRLLEHHERWAAAYRRKLAPRVVP